MTSVNEDVRFRALANSTRRTLLRLVRDDARSVGALADELEMTQPAVSQHLAVLRDAGLVRVEARGRQRWYRTDTASVAELRSFFDEYWSQSVDRLATSAEGHARRRKRAS